jgi:hypothetical protein
MRESSRLPLPIGRRFLPIRLADLAGHELFDDEPAARRWIFAQQVK